MTDKDISLAIASKALNEARAYLHDQIPPASRLTQEYVMSRKYYDTQQTLRLVDMALGAIADHVPQGEPVLTDAGWLPIGVAND